MEKILEHIEIVVKNMNSAIEIFRRLFDLSEIQIQDYKNNEIHCKVVLVSFGGIKLELIQKT